MAETKRGRRDGPERVMEAELGNVLATVTNGTVVDLGRGDRTALVGIVIGVAATIAAMALPMAYPDVPVRVWRLMIWGAVFVIIFCSAALFNDYVVAPRLTAKGNMGPSIAMAVGALLFIGGAIWHIQTRPVTVSKLPVPPAADEELHEKVPPTQAGPVGIRMENAHNNDIRATIIGPGPGIELKDSSGNRIDANISIGPASISQGADPLRMSSNLHLKAKAQTIAIAMRHMHDDYKAKMRGPISADTLAELMDEENKDYSRNLRTEALRVRDAIQARLGISAQDRATGQMPAFRGVSAGAHPLIDGADYLEALAARLPD